MIPRTWADKLLWFDEADLFMWLYWSRWYQFGWAKFAMAGSWFWFTRLISFDYRNAYGVRYE